MAEPHLALTRLIRDFSYDPEGLGDVAEGIIDFLDAQDDDSDLEPDADGEPYLSTGAERWNVQMIGLPDLEIDETETATMEAAQ